MHVLTSSWALLAGFETADLPCTRVWTEKHSYLFLLESLFVSKCLWFMVGDQFNKLSYEGRFSVQLFSSSLSLSCPRLFISYWLSFFVVSRSGGWKIMTWFRGNRICTECFLVEIPTSSSITTRPTGNDEWSSTFGRWNIRFSSGCSQ